jgi:PD-(D/E)XK nuclease superfamily
VSSPNTVAVDSAFDTPGGTGAQIPRDRWNRPLITPPDGGKPTAYTRCTTFVDVLEDKYALQQWQLRQVALGLADRPDLLLSVSAHRDDKRQLTKITEQALEAAKSSAASTTGTALHALCERLDRGQPLGIVPDTARADLDAYRAATTELEFVHIEQFSVNDRLRIGGTPDRVVKWHGDHLIGDLKTQQDMTFGGLKIAMQLAVYAHSVPYLPGPDGHGERQPYQFEINTSRAIVIHLPAGQATCTLHLVNIDLGWQAVQTAFDVRQWRAIKNWYEPLPSVAHIAEQLDARQLTGSELIDIRIDAATTIDELRAVWTAAVEAGTWTDEHLNHALNRKTQLEKETR